VECWVGYRVTKKYLRNIKSWRPEMSRIPHCLDSRLTDGSYALAALYAQKDLLVLISVRG
jgi:hypothetical protein